MKQGWCVYSLSMKQCLGSVNHKQFPMKMTQNNKHNKWWEILAGKDNPLKVLPHGERRLKFHHKRRQQQQHWSRKTEGTSLSTAKATLSTQQPQTCTETATEYYNYTANEAEGEGTPTAGASKSDEEIAMLAVYSKIIFFNATIGSNSYMMCTHNAHQEYLSIGLRTADQPLHHEQQWVLQ